MSITTIELLTNEQRGWTHGLLTFGNPLYIEWFEMVRDQREEQP